MKKANVIVLGSFNADITAFTPSFPLDGQTVMGSELKIGAGGKGTNAATSCARCGADVTMIAKLGSDSLAQVGRQHFANEGIDDKFIFTSEKSSTGSAVIEVSEQNGQNKIIVISGANMEITDGEIDSAESKFSSCDVFLTQLEVNISAIKHGLALAKKYDKITILNPAPAAEIPSDLYAYVDYFTPNETEAEFYSGIKVTDYESASKAGKQLIEKLGVKNVIITLGDKGALLVTESECVSVGARPVTAVDTTGAGDAFNGAFATAIAEGRNAVDAIKFANAVSSIEVTGKGASPSIPYRAESDRVMKEFYGI